MPQGVDRDERQALLLLRLAGEDALNAFEDAGQVDKRGAVVTPQYRYEQLNESVEVRWRGPYTQPIRVAQPVLRRDRNTHNAR